jgi:chromosome segregation ATPase
MSIEWQKVEDKPDKDVKVQGKLLIDFRTKIVNLERDTASMKEDIARLSKAKSDLEANLKNANETIKKNEAKIQDLEKSGKDKDAQINEKNNTIASLSGKNEGMKVSLDTTIADKDSRFKQLMEEKNTMKENLDKKITALESDKTMLKESEAGMKNRIQAMEKDMITLEREIESVRKERDDLAEKLKISDDEMAARDYGLFKKMLKERAERAAKTIGDKKL